MRFHSYLKLLAILPVLMILKCMRLLRLSIQTDIPNTYLISLQISQNQPSTFIFTPNLLLLYCF